jgi:LPXTG-motif cell wall-anchored protein
MYEYFVLLLSLIFLIFGVIFYWSNKPASVPTPSTPATPETGSNYAALTLLGLAILLAFIAVLIHLWNNYTRGSAPTLQKSQKLF